MLSVTWTYIVKLDSNIYIKFTKVKKMRIRGNSWTLTVWEFGDGFVHILETPKNISQAGCRPEILLFEAKLFPNYDFTSTDQLQVIITRGRGAYTWCDRLDTIQT